MQPGPFSVATLFRPPVADPWIVTALAIPVVGYLFLVLRLSWRGTRWPAARTLSWLAGVAVLAAFARMSSYQSHDARRNACTYDRSG
jgi:putative copper resistance protein D